MFFLRIVALFSICLLMPAFSSNWKIKSLVVFGGGDSDNGNSYRLYKIPVMPPYWHGRFSNGPAWDEYLAYDFGLIPNPVKNPDYDKNKLFLTYAYYGATATNKYVINNKYLMTLNDEVSQYALNKHPPVKNTLAAVYAGENDLFGKDCLAEPLTCLKDVTTAEKSALLRLCGLGLRHFIVFTLGDQADMPYFVRIYDPEQRQTLEEIASQYAANFADIKQTVESRYPSAQVMVYSSADYEPNWMRSFNQPTSIPCYWNIDKSNQFIYDKQIGPVCSDPNKYYYFDSFYATTSANKILGDSVYKTILNYNWHDHLHQHWWQVFSY